MSKEIQKRFEQRVLPNNWHNIENGADEYLKKYGKGISQQKLKDLKQYADENNYKLFSNGLSKHIIDDNNIDYMRNLVGKERERVNDDALEEYEDKEEWGNDIRLVETTFYHLSKIKARHNCGDENCFEPFLTNGMGHLKVLCAYKSEKCENHYFLNAISSFDVYLETYEQGEHIQEITRARFEDYNSSPNTFKAGWFYFESE